MYPELYPELEGRHRKLRGFALSLAGSFVFMVTSLASAAFVSQWLLLFISGFSLGTVGLIFAAFRSRSLVWQVGLLVAASAVLASETAVVGFFFREPLAAVSAVLTLAGCLVAARGIHDIESTIGSDPFAPKRRREVQVEQHAGGE